ncbi:MAG: type II toxin-antitoxin system RelE/ParE family toxin [Thermoanaerobaculia bacterium]
MDWLDNLPSKARAKCQVRLERLREQGHRLRRPEADYLRDGIHELRAKHLGVNYRILYFFFGREAIVASHGLVKQQAAVPPKEIDLAIQRKGVFERDPEAHSYEETN